MDVTPVTHFYESMRSNIIGWHDAFAELIDNSFDADAMRVEIECDGTRTSISDDGIGAPDLASMIRLGGHSGHRRQGLGTYGVGFKDAWLYIGDTAEIKTTHKGQTLSLRVNLRTDIKQVDGRWEAPDPLVVPASNGDRGTHVVFPVRHSYRHTPKQDIVRKLGLTFMPAIESGKQIIFKKRNKRTPIEPYKIPPLLDRIVDSFSVGGKDVSIDIGITLDGHHVEHPGFLMCYGHRVIRVSPIGMAGYSASRVTGKVVLGNGWRLTKNKNDLVDLAEPLGDAIHSRIKFLCEKAEQLSEDIESRELLSTVEGMMNSMLAGVKKREKRPGSGDSEGTVQPKHTERKRRRAASVDESQPGSVEVPGLPGGTRRRGVSLKWFSAEESIIGQPDSLSNCVLLNKDNAFMAHCKRLGIKEAILSVAMGVWLHDLYNTKGKQKLAFEMHDYVSGWGRVMNSLKFDAKEGDSDAA